MIKRGNYPFEGLWALPGGFLEMDEDLPECARRELKEETGLSVDTLTQFRTYGKPGRDPRGRTITVIYYGFAENENVSGGDDAAEAAWFPLQDLPQLAFDHREIIDDFTRAVYPG